MRWAFKVAYLGTRFHGSQRQPGLRTVEGEILSILRSAAILTDPAESRFEVASRTDRGVHAMGNVFALNSERDPREVGFHVNQASSDIWVYAYAPTSEDFRPRWALERWYRYFFPGDLAVGPLRDGAAMFEGRHDFRSFAKGTSGGLCSISSLEFQRLGAFVVMDLRADRFLRTMVRRIAQGLELHARGRLSRDVLEKALQGSSLPLEPAPPERLFLMDVRYDFPFTNLENERVGRSAQRAVDVGSLESLTLSELSGFPSRVAG